jgi:L-threonylcarbamoyladenylate synthase
MQTTTGTDIQTAAACLQQDELVAIPTETVYGLAGNALHEAAVVKIYEAKQRPRFNPLIIHVPEISSIERYADMDNISRTLAEAFMPGPFTLLLPKRSIIPDLVTAGSDKVAVRIPDHPLTRDLLRQIAFPLAAPSANRFGYVSPTTAEHVLQGLGGTIPYILDGGACVVGLESTIVEVLKDKVILHRAGGVSADMIEQCVHMRVVLPDKSSLPHTPGQLKSHYATSTPLYRGDIMQLLNENPGKKAAVISFTKKYELPVGSHLFVLSPEGNLGEAAQKLFATMRMIDMLSLDVIIAEIFPEEGIGRAINDRLNRAQVIYK